MSSANSDADRYRRVRSFRIAFIVKGKIVKTDSVKNLLQPLQGRRVMLVSVSGEADGLKDRLASAFPDYAFRSASPKQIRIESRGPIDLGPLVRFIEQQGTEVEEARRVGPSLEDVFVSVTGIEADILKKEVEKKGGRP